MVYNTLLELYLHEYIHEKDISVSNLGDTKLFSLFSIHHLCLALLRLYVHYVLHVIGNWGAQVLEQGMRGVAGVYTGPAARDARGSWGVYRSWSKGCEG